MDVWMNESSQALFCSIFIHILQERNWGYASYLLTVISERLLMQIQSLGFMLGR